MNILYIGNFSPNSLLAIYPDLGLDTYKTSEFLIRGFRQIDEVYLRVITAPNVGSYPKFSQKIIKREITEDGTISVGFYNYPVIKQLMITKALYNEACKIIEASEGKTYVIIPYVVLHYVRVARKLKKRLGNKVIICQIVPDIFFPKKCLHRKVNARAEMLAAKSDVFVFFTKAMAEYYNVPEKRYIVMESVIDGSTYKNVSSNKNIVDGKLKVVYTGALGIPNGVAKLIEMMRFLNRDDFELVVTGRGTLAEEFSKASNEDSRIRFMGTVPKQDVFKYQSQADVLINPRSDKDAPLVTRYMFPSKLMEYMLTGNVALTCRMEGIPEEYYNYVYVSQLDSPEGLADALNKVLDLSSEERNEKGQKAREYILTNKTIPVQTRRIVDFLKKF